MTNPVFHIDDPEFQIIALNPESADRLQAFFEQCADFAMLVEGEPVSPAAAQDTFESLPPGKTLQDKFVFGVSDAAGGLAGVLEAVRGYPEPGTWWIGLMMLTPAARGRGLGQKLIEGFARYVRSQRGQAVMLGVVEENQAGYRFWQRAGFVRVRETEPRVFGKKTQRVFVMQRDLPPERE